MFLLALAAGTALAAIPVDPPDAAPPAYTVTVDPGDTRPWEGWGCSLSWWANVAGSSKYQSLYADLLFGHGDRVHFLDTDLPALGLSIVRYNLGGSGRPNDIPGAPENVGPNVPAYKRIEGYWTSWDSPDPASRSWDFWRDSNQRNMMWAARDRGANEVEFFVNSPMWWMKDSLSADGGSLHEWNRRDFAHYVAASVRYALDRWGVRVVSVEPFNEPSAGWWNFGPDTGQEGANVSRTEQQILLPMLRDALDREGLTSLPIAAADENSMPAAVKTLSAVGSDFVGKINVHGYNGLSPWREGIAGCEPNGPREQLRTAAGSTPLWMSEYGDGDGSGMTLAQTITEDLKCLRPQAWIYWQPVEPVDQGADPHWGLVNAYYAKGPSDPARARPADIQPKYYVMAQFTRFIRPGSTILGTNDHNTIAAYDPQQRAFSFVTVNYGAAQTIAYDVSSIAGADARATITETNTAGPSYFHTTSALIAGGVIRVDAAPNSVYSIRIDGASFGEPAPRPGPL